MKGSCLELDAFWGTTREQVAETHGGQCEKGGTEDTTNQAPAPQPGTGNEVQTRPVKIRVEAFPEPFVSAFLRTSLCSILLTEDGLHLPAQGFSVTL